MWNYKYKIIYGSYERVEAELNKLAKANPAGIKLVHIEDYTAKYEMVIVVRICYGKEKRLVR